MVDDRLLAENTDCLRRVITYRSLHPIIWQRIYMILDYYCNPDLPILAPHESQVVMGIVCNGETGLDVVDLS